MIIKLASIYTDHVMSCDRWALTHFLQLDLGSMRAVAKAPEMVVKEVVLQVVSKFVAELMLSLF